MVNVVGSTSSYAAGAHSVFETLRARGVEPESVLREVGLSAAEFDIPGNRIDTESFCHFLQRACERSKLSGFGLTTTDYMHPTTFHALGFALLSSSTLRAYFNRWQRYYSLIATHATMTVLEEKDHLLLEYRFLGPAARYPLAARVIREANLALVIKFIRFMYQPDYTPFRVELMHESFAGAEQKFREYLGEHVVPSAERNAIWLNIDDVDRPLPAANAELARLNDEAVVRFLAKMDRANVPAQVRAKLVELLPSGACSKAQVASALFMSVRTLHNRLAKSGTNYQKLLDETRQGLAEQYMRQPDISVSEIAYLLGFSDCSNFSRAFQRWTDRAPSQYRKDVLTQGL